MGVNEALLLEGKIWRFVVLIFITVGNATQRFTRLLNEIDKLSEDGLFGTERIIVQVGNNAPLISRKVTSVSFFEMEEFESFVQTANLIISHAGIGSLMHILRCGKIPIVMPRMTKYNEIINDHQLQIVEYLAASSRIYPVFEASGLRASIQAYSNNSMNFRTTPAIGSPLMTNLVAAAIHRLSKL